MAPIRAQWGRAVGFVVLATHLPVGASSATAQGPPPAGTPSASTASAAPVLTLADADIERFLTHAKVVDRRDAGKGVTNSVRATLSDGTMIHEAHIQIVDEYRREFRSTAGMELDFRDSWMFNVAAYKLDRLLGLNMVPVSVPGRLHRDPAAITWWVDDVAMDEGTRVKKGMRPPPEKAAYWSEQLHMLRLFDELIYNTDRNMGNMLIGQDWRLWGIDHTRAFRKHKELKNPAHVVRCDRAVFERLKALDRETLVQETGRFLDGGQITAILARRDLIVGRLERTGGAALFDRQSGAPPVPSASSAP